MRKLTLEIEFEVGTQDEMGYGGGFKSTWLEGTNQETGVIVELLSGSGMGNPYLEGEAHDADGGHLIARADMRPLARRLWGEMEHELGKDTS